MYEGRLRRAHVCMQCPCLEHLACHAPYLSIGANDTASAIHQTNESVLLANVPLSAKQFVAFLQRLAVA